MRVRFGNHIDECKRIRHPDDSDLLLITANNSVYTIKCTSVSKASELFYDALTEGYLDVSGYEYSN